MVFAKLDGNFEDPREILRKFHKIDIYLEYAKAPHSDNCLRYKRTIIGALEQFDIYGRFPDGRHRHSLFERGSYHLLVPEFQELIDFYRVTEEQRGKKESTIRGESYNAASFLYKMQEKGCSSLECITEDAVLSFFISDDGTFIKSYSYKKNISAVFKAGLNWREKECRMVLNYLPALRENRKNIQYLTAEEVCQIRETIDSGCVSMRNKAVIFLLLYTGLRGCDIAALKLEFIDWTREKLSISQRKTDVPFELPLSVIVGNAIFKPFAPLTEVVNTRTAPRMGYPCFIQIPPEVMVYVLQCHLLLMMSLLL